jgi:DNA-binding transcriptional LysR family regulator
MVVVVGQKSPWARRRKVDIAELHAERWILTTGDRWNYQVISRAFAQRALGMPKIAMKTISVHLRANNAATGHFITTLPRSVLDLYAARFGLKPLPIELPGSAWPVKIATLRKRTLSPVVERFIACARDVAKPRAQGLSRLTGC